MPAGFWSLSFSSAGGAAARAVASRQGTTKRYRIIFELSRTPLQRIDLPQHGFRAGPYAYVIGQVDPQDRAGGIHQKFGRPGDILAVLAGSGVQYSVAPDDFRAGVGQEREFVALAAAKLA